MTRFPVRLVSTLLVSFAVACGSDGPASCCTNGTPALRVVNALTTPVDVVIDGAVVIQSLAAGSIGMAAPIAGNHTLVLRPTSGAASATIPITTTTGAMNTFAAVRTASGGVASATLDDTGSVVPAGATKVRVLHLAPNAGELQVYRTQPDFQQPVSRQFPFTYQAQPTALSAPFYQSTPGSWEIRVWQTPASAAGWATATVRIVIPLSSGEKKTVLILDNPAGGVRIELI